MHAFKKFGCKVFCPSLILVVLHLLSFFVTANVLSISQQILFKDTKPNTFRSTCTTLEKLCMTGQLFCNSAPQMNKLKIFSPRTLLKKTHLPLFNVGGEFITVNLVNYLVFSLKGVFVPIGISSFPHLEFFSIFRVNFCKG